MQIAGQVLDELLLGVARPGGVECFLAGLTQVVEAWESVNREFDITNLRWVVHHVPEVNADLLTRLKALGCGVEMGAFRWVTSSDPKVVAGPPFRSIVDHGIQVVRIPVQQVEPAAAQARTAGLDNGESRGDGDRRIEGVAAGGENFLPRAGRERMRARYCGRVGDDAPGRGRGGG